MPSAGLRSRVEAVPGTPLPHGLLGGCTDVIEVTNPHELLGTEWVPLSCSEAHDTTWCPPEGDPEVPPKTFERPGSCTAPPVTIYAGSECSTFGQSYQEAVRHAEETLRLGEQRALEEWLMREVLCEIGEDRTPAAGAVSIAQGIGALETWLGTEYGGTGLLHVPVGVGALLGCCNVVHLVDGAPETLVGNCVILGAGYAVNVGPPDCTVPDPGEAWLYATSPIRVRREAPVTVPASDGESVAIRTNDRRILVESTFVVEIACCRAAAVRVTICPE